MTLTDVTARPPVADRLAAMRARIGEQSIALVAADRLARAARKHGEDAAQDGAAFAIARGTDATTGAWQYGKQAKSNAIRDNVRRAQNEQAAGLLTTDEAPTMLARESATDAAERVLRIMGQHELTTSPMIVTRAPSPGAIVLALVEGRPVPTSAPATVVPVWHSPRMGALMADAPILKAHDGIGRPSDHAREALGTMGKHGRIKVAAAHRAPAETVRPWRGAHGDVVLNREASLTSLMDPTRNHYGRDKGANAWTATTESDALRPYSLLLALADVHTHDAPGRNGLAVDWSALAVTLDMPETTVRPWVAAMVAARFAVGTTVTQSGAASTAASRAKALGKRGIGTDGFRDAVATARTHGDGFRRIRAERVAILSPARNVGIANASPAKGWHAAGKVARARHGLIAKFGGFGSPAIARPNVTVATAGRRVRIARPDGTAVTI